MKKLCVLEFNSAKGNKYIYDGNTSIVLAVDDILKDCIRLFENTNDLDLIKNTLFERYNDKRKIDIAVKFVENCKKKGAFYRNELYEKKQRKWMNKFDSESVKAALEKAGFMEQIILNVTENCNLRCKYCYWSEIYENTRNRTVNVMTSEVALKALDYFFDKMKKISDYNPGKECAITFYGGEPLLNFKLIKECIEYTKKNCPTSYIFNMTTNGLLLKGEILEYLVKNEVYIGISFDGSKENHDRLRVDEKNMGSHERILSNLHEINSLYPHYDKITILGVFDFGTNLIDNNIFFNTNNLPRISYINQVMSKNTQYYNQFDETQINNFQKQYLNMLNLFIENKKKRNLPNEYADMLFETSLSLVLGRAHMGDERLPIIPFTNTCLPGTKISVRADGVFDICEKIDYNYPIGNVYQGLCYDHIVSIIKKYNQNVTNECHNCVLSKICSCCYVQSIKGKDFAPINCNEQLDTFKFQFSLVYSLYEEDPTIFDYYTIQKQPSDVG